MPFGSSGRKDQPSPSNFTSIPDMSATRDWKTTQGPGLENKNKKNLAKDILTASVENRGTSKGPETKKEENARHPAGS